MTEPSRLWTRSSETSCTRSTRHPSLPAPERIRMAPAQRESDLHRSLIARAAKARSQRRRERLCLRSQKAWIAQGHRETLLLLPREGICLPPPHQLAPKAVFKLYQLHPRQSLVWKGARLTTAHAAPQRRPVALRGPTSGVRAGPGRILPQLVPHRRLMPANHRLATATLPLPISTKRPRIPAQTSPPIVYPGPGPLTLHLTSNTNTMLNSTPTLQTMTAAVCLPLLPRLRPRQNTAAVIS